MGKKMDSSMHYSKKNRRKDPTKKLQNKLSYEKRKSSSGYPGKYPLKKSLKKETHGGYPRKYTSSYEKKKTENKIKSPGKYIEEKYVEHYKEKTLHGIPGKDAYKKKMDSSMHYSKKNRRKDPKKKLQNKLSDEKRKSSSAYPGKYNGLYEKKKREKRIKSPGKYIEEKYVEH